MPLKENDAEAEEVHAEKIQLMKQINEKEETVRRLKAETEMLEKVGITKLKSRLQELEKRERNKLQEEIEQHSSETMQEVGDDASCQWANPFHQSRNATATSLSRRSSITSSLDSA
ncbi:hypothetical protein G7Y89_g7624 [Cudoniella acicularis]|uniref:Uncharacterized protein n=1 Tax=Cudoniella acicularis TaxID=354080 RepID=A0A8H4RK44_9HELO|nr:hypothetical protein G7Y89_g7624 [Cudoniella acicularis]